MTTRSEFKAAVELSTAGDGELDSTRRRKRRRAIEASKRKEWSVNLCAEDLKNGRGFDFEYERF